MIVLILALVGVASGLGQFGPVWERVGQCGSLVGSDSRLLEGGRVALARQAALATRVRMCIWNSTTDCVTSRPETFPILNFRDGHTLLSHLSTGPCDRDCVQATWDGPPQRLSELRTTCGAIGEGAMADIDDRWFYFSCGNRQGLVMSQQPGPCAWPQHLGGANIEIFIDSGTAAPTAAPTAFPTAWYQDDGHRTNFAEVQTRLSELERQLRATQADDVGADAERSRMAATLVNLQVTVDQLTTGMNTLIGNVSAIRAALIEAATGRSTGGSSGMQVPSIGTAGQDISISAPLGSISLNSRSCNNIDLCDTSSFTERLQAALRDFD